jgi:hypothetical protein
MSLAAALLAFQAEAPTLPKDSVGKIVGTSKSGKAYEYMYRYTDLATIMEQITPLLAKHGLTWTTRPTGTHDAPTLTYELLWEGEPQLRGDIADDLEPVSHEAIAGEMPLYLPEHPTSQTLGSAITYARRYALTAVLNLVADEDDDGQAATSATVRKYGNALPTGRQDTGEAATEPQKKRIKADLSKAGINSWKQQNTIYRALFSADLREAQPIWERVTKKQAGMLIDRLAQGAIPTGESDVPSDDAPQHERVPQDDTLPFS